MTTDELKFTAFPSLLPLENLIRHWESALLHTKYLMDPSTAQIVEDTVRHLLRMQEMDGTEFAVSALKKLGLFAMPLNNGDWCVGKATYTYHLDLTDDHYANPNLSIDTELIGAIRKHVRNMKGKEGGERGHRGD